MRLLTRPLVSEIKEGWKRSYCRTNSAGTFWTRLPHWEPGTFGVENRIVVNTELIYKNLEALDDSATIEQINEATKPYTCSYRMCNECREYIENAVELQDDGEYGSDHICKKCVEEALKLFGE